MKCGTGKLLAIVAAILVGAYSPARATDLLLSAPIALDAQQVANGPTFIATGDFGPSDTISLHVQGVVELSSGTYHTNAAGVITGPATTHTGNHPGEILLNSSGSPPGEPYPYGTVLLGNAALGFHPVFPANAANGLGNSTPPTDLAVTNEPLSAVFGASFMIHRGDTLEFRVNDDTLVADNSGTYTLSSPAPMPATIAAAGVGQVVVILGILGIIALIAGIVGIIALQRRRRLQRMP